ncbi:hypothetical protein SAMN05660964_03378, partial [Thiothrix caldifontis]
MKFIDRNLLIKFIYLILMSIAPSLTWGAWNHSDSLTQDSRWESDDIHILDTNIIIPANVKLTISAGTEIRVVDGAGITVQAGGHLVMQGTEVSPVVLSSADTDALPGDWAGIKAEAGATVSLEHV